MANIFLVPASQENVDKTIVGSVSLSKVAPHLRSSDVEALRRELGDADRFHC